MFNQALSRNSSKNSRHLPVVCWVGFGKKQELDKQYQVVKLKKENSTTTRWVKPHHLLHIITSKHNTSPFYSAFPTVKNRPYALTSCLHNNDAMLGVKTCRAARTCCAGRALALSVSARARAGWPGGMACRGWPAGCMLGDGAGDSASFDPQHAGAPFCDIICIRSICAAGLKQQHKSFHNWYCIPDIVIWVIKPCNSIFF